MCTPTQMICPSAVTWASCPSLTQPVNEHSVHLNNTCLPCCNTTTVCHRRVPLRDPSAGSTVQQSD
jgi:hypothetical protein